MNNASNKIAPLISILVLCCSYFSAQGMQNSEFNTTPHNTNNSQSPVNFSPFPLNGNSFNNSLEEDNFTRNTRAQLELQLSNYTVAQNRRLQNHLNISLVSVYVDPELRTPNSEFNTAFTSYTSPSSPRTLNFEVKKLNPISAIFSHSKEDKLYKEKVNQKIKQITQYQEEETKGNALIRLFHNNEDSTNDNNADSTNDSCRLNLTKEDIQKIAIAIVNIRNL